MVMAVSSTETEIKYEAPADVALPSFAELAEVARAEEAADEQLDAVYFDTEDLRLIRAGVTLRRRQGGHDAGWHLKIPGGNDARREIAVPLGRTRQRVPEELARMVMVHTRGRELKAVARISTARTRQLLLDDAGEQLAEVASDDVTARALGDSPGVSRWREVEVELTGGSRDVLDAADRLLARAGLSRARRSAKLARALDFQSDGQERQPHAGAAWQAGQTSLSSPAGKVLAAYLASQVSALHAVAPLVRPAT